MSQSSSSQVLALSIRAELHNRNILTHQPNTLDVGSGKYYWHHPTNKSHKIRVSSHAVAKIMDAILFEIKDYKGITPESGVPWVPDGIQDEEQMLRFAVEKVVAEEAGGLGVLYPEHVPVEVEIRKVRRV